MAEIVRTNLSPSRFHRLLGDAFYQNSLFIILSSVTSSGLGLLFWMVAAQYYSITDVGLAATVVSTTALIVSLTGLGMDQSMIRYFPNHDRSRVFGTTMKMTVLFSVLLGVLLVLGAPLWMSTLATSPMYGILFVVLICVTNIAFINHTAFVGVRKAKYGWAQNLLLGSRVLLLAPLVGLQSLGIPVALTLSYVLALIISCLFLVRSEITLGRFDRSFLKESLWFSAGNYVASFLFNLPYLALPLIVFSLIGSDEAAIYYMALSVATIVFLIPNAFTTSLFVEGSHGESLAATVKKSVMVTYAILIPLIIVFLLMGQWLLGILGEEYASQGEGVLRLMIISSLFLTMFQVESTILKVKGHINGVMIIGAISSIGIFALSYLFVPLYGTEGIGYAWICSYALSAAVGAILIRAARGNPSKAS